MFDLAKYRDDLEEFVDSFVWREKSKDQEEKFSEYYHDIFLRVANYILWAEFFALLLPWPTDYYLFSPKIADAYMIFRPIILTFILFCLYLLNYHEQLVRENFTLFITVMPIIANFFTAYVFGSVTPIGSPWQWLCVVFPVYGFFLPVKLLKRLFISLLLAMSWYIGFIVPNPAHWSWQFHDIALILVLSASVAIAFLGNFYFGLIRRNFFQQEELAAEREKVEEERKRSEELLLNILPQQVSEKLKEGEDISERFEETTVLFADIVNFTPLANQLSAEDLVNQLDKIFSSFDRKLQTNGIEKIKTIGDEYFVVGGVPEQINNHAVLSANFALEMLESTNSFIRDDNGGTFNLRIGMHTGPLVAGIIGEDKFVYDVWGDTVNIGSRMESQGEPGKIQVTPATKKAIEEQDDEGRFEFEKRGQIDVKGKGEMTTYFLMNGLG